MKNHFHIKGWALNLILIQRPRGSWKWPIVLPPPPKKIYIYTPTMDTLGARDFSCTVSILSQVFIVNHAKSFFLRLCSLWLQPSTEESVSLEPTCKKKPLVPRAIMEGLLHWDPPPPPPPPPPRPPNNTTITRLKIPHWVMFTIGNWSKDIFERHVLTGSEAFSLDCAFRCCQMFIVTGLSLSAGAGDFPWLLWTRPRLLS